MEEPNVDELIRLNGLTKSFPQKGGAPVTILRDVDLVISEGQTLCVLGESGCGKTTLGKIIAGLSSYTGGSYLYRGQEINRMKGAAKQTFRNEVQLIHQNPYESLNPALMVFDIIANPIKRHRGLHKIDALYAEVTKLLQLVGLTPVEDFVDKYPAFLSGGQRQRVSIARVLAMNPKLIVVDEATSMIDTSLRINLLSTLKDIQSKLNVSYFFITHDLALGRYFARGQNAMVLYLGGIVESAPMDTLVTQPMHPYTKAVISAAVGSTELLERTSLHKYTLRSAEIASFNRLPSGCPLHPRCLECIAGLCEHTLPQKISISADHAVACHLYDTNQSE